MAGLFFLMSFSAWSQARPFKSSVKTPDTKAELANETKTPEPKVVEQEQAPTAPTAPAPRQIQKHSLGLGLGQTFLLGKYGEHGDSKITADVLYPYSASYSFDILVNVHYSSHSSGSEGVRLMGLNAALKARLFEFDNFSPFFLGGLGFYSPQEKREVSGRMRWSDEKITFGANFGGGVDLRLNSNWVVGALGQLHWPFTIKQEHGPDVKGYYFKLLMTLSYLF